MVSLHYMWYIFVGIVCGLIWNIEGWGRFRGEMVLVYENLVVWGWGWTVWGVLRNYLLYFWRFYKKLTFWG